MKTIKTIKKTVALPPQTENIVFNSFFHVMPIGGPKVNIPKFWKPISTWIDI